MSPETSLVVRRAHVVRATSICRPGSSQPRWRTRAGVTLVHGWESARDRISLALSSCSRLPLLTFDVRGHGANPPRHCRSRGRVRLDGSRSPAILGRPEVTSGAIAGPFDGGDRSVLAARGPARGRDRGDLAPADHTSHPQTFRLARLPIPTHRLSTRLAGRPACTSGRGGTSSPGQRDDGDRTYRGPVLLVHGARRRRRAGLAHGTPRDRRSTARAADPTPSRSNADRSGRTASGSTGRARTGRPRAIPGDGRSAGHCSPMRRRPSPPTPMSYACRPPRNGCQPSTPFKRLPDPRRCRAAGSHQPIDLDALAAAEPGPG